MVGAWNCGSDWLESDFKVRFGLRWRIEWRERGCNCEKTGLIVR